MKGAASLRACERLSRWLATHDAKLGRFRHPVPLSEVSQELGESADRIRTVLSDSPELIYHVWEHTYRGRVSRSKPYCLRLGGIDSVSLKAVASPHAVPWPESAISSAVLTPLGQIEVHNAHIPPGTSHGWLKIETLEAIYAGLAIQSERPRILCGDFNMPQEENQDGTILTWAERRNKKGESVLKPKRGKRWDQAERNVLLGLGHFDLVDVYRHLNGYATQAYSWYARRKGKRVGRRFDHIFASTTLRPLRCLYLEHVVTQSLSDHAAVEADFDPREVSV